MSTPIEDYAIIGDLHSAALVSRNGSIDWLCLPHFASPACFAALLGDESNGYWRIAPVDQVRSVSRRYRPGSLILETDLTTDSGTIRITDFMPTRRHHPVIIRIVEGLEGTVPVRSALSLRFGYGKTRPWLRPIGGGWQAIGGPDGIMITSPLPLSVDGHDVVSEFTVTPGNRQNFQIIWHLSWEGLPRPRDAEWNLVSTDTWWREWSKGSNATGPYRDAIVRSLITLKALTYHPSGGIVAAATTSLPEQIGGVRNWDYRYCWLRDSALTLMALNACGLIEEAKSWREWLLRAVAGEPDEMQIMYGISGERDLAETEIGWLAGYAESRPVRKGNAAHKQFQLDVYGEVLAAFHAARAAGLHAKVEGWSLQLALARFVAEHWQEPDDGIWEVRGGKQHFTYSKVMAWAAADSIARGISEFGHDGDLGYWTELADTIKADVLDKGVDPDRHCFVQHYGTKAVDASLLLIPIFGFLPPDDPRVVATVRAVEEELVEDGLVLRYRERGSGEGSAGREGSFVICSFWLVQALVLIGQRDKAEQLFHRLLGLRNDVGLLAEEYDPVAARMLGNVPQAFSHVGLISAALALTQQDE